MWQALFDELKDQNFSIITVAMDADAEAARPFIEAAAPDYISLIDRDHRVAGLYNMVNVPQAVWIDESGQIVRPPEVAGTYDTVRSRDKVTREVPAEVQARRDEARIVYQDAIRDWVKHGAESKHVFSPAEVKARLTIPDDHVATAHANFRLGQFLMRQGKPDAAEPLFTEARRLHPESWTIWRETEEKNEAGLAAGPTFWARIDALGEKKFYDAVDMAGMPG